MRFVLAIPLDEVRRYFSANARQSLKVVAPERLGPALLEKLRERGVDPKPEVAAEDADIIWRHSGPDEPNRLIESGEMAGAGGEIAGGFTISFGTEHGEQDAHVHRRHTEIYFSEHPLAAEFRVEQTGERGALDLPHGGALVFAPGVAHRVRLGGLTIVIEAPAVAGDKYGAETV